MLLRARRQGRLPRSRSVPHQAATADMRRSSAGCSGSDEACPSPCGPEKRCSNSCRGSSASLFQCGRWDVICAPGVLTPQKRHRRAYERDPAAVQEMAGARIPGRFESRHGAAGANSLVRRDGIAYQHIRQQAGRSYGLTRPNTCGLGDRAAFPMQHDLGDRQSKGVSRRSCFFVSASRPESSSIFSLCHLLRPCAILPNRRKPEEGLSDSR